MEYNSILYQKSDHILTIRFNNPKARNALSMELRMELLDALHQAEEDKEIKAIIITGEGKAFSAGGDLTALKEVKILEGRERLQRSHQLITKLLEIEKPVIAAVNGAAAGAGFSIALLCDLIIASRESFFVQSFVNVGLIPDLGVIHTLPMLIGPQKAKELMFLGERFSAEEAQQIGIVNRVVPSEELIKESMNYAKKLIKKSPVSIGMTKKIMNQHFNKDLKMLLESEAQAQDICFQTQDFKEGVHAFFEKREPNFIGK